MGEITICFVANTFAAMDQPLQRTYTKQKEYANSTTKGHGLRNCTHNLQSSFTACLILCVMFSQIPNQTQMISSLSSFIFFLHFLCFKWLLWHLQLAVIITNAVWQSSSSLTHCHFGNATSWRLLEKQMHLMRITEKRKRIWRIVMPWSELTDQKTWTVEWIQHLCY